MDEIALETLGRHLQALRQAQGLSLTQLAAQAEIAKSNLSRLEQGIGNPTIDTLWRLAKQLGVPFGTLVAPVATPVEENGVSVHLVEQSHHQRHDEPAVDVYLMRCAPGTIRQAEPHPPGTRETLQVIEGRVSVGPAGESRQLAAGEIFTFAADRPHDYRVSDMGATLLVTIVYAREGPSNG
ncbi:helix-turn-helix domain-containing protein [Salinicola acroporae]|uniref:XRE family transcriptional regulator n=1 Tax=Salinicola acroporae TaxID=1541440 RepID=A0ABT6I7T8_9GAMM|nr:helix-turn-helix transcriptional regulator [Salinicola acroporae]MDH4573784.1 XRE family transcriptional regulator [Salinicola acroporae]